MRQVAPATEAPPGWVPARFRAGRILKDGQGVTTLLGTDSVDGSAVVIKVASSGAFPAAAHMRLEHTSLMLRAVNGTTLARPTCHGDEDGMAYVVSPFVAGVSLKERLARGPLGIREAIAIGRAILAALAEAHRHGVLHLDIKPSNVILDDDADHARPVHAVLVDFGFARSGLVPSTLDDPPVANATYVSPEHAGLLERGVDERSDLYTVGLLVFECVSGRPPFEGERLGDLLRQHLTAEPPSLASLRPGVPRTLERIVEHLLRKEPRDRYQSAAAAQHDLEQLEGALARGEGDLALVLGLQDRRRTLTEPAFVGRKAELARLDAEIEKAKQGDGGVVLIEAESGGGKTRLLDEMARRAGQRAWMLRARGSDQSAERPFHILSGVVDELLAACRTDLDLAARARRELAAHTEALVGVLPKLAEVLAPSSDGGRAPEMTLGPETHAEARSLPALAAMLDALGTSAAPAVVLFDDAQWADELTIKLVGYWSRRRPPSGERHVIVIVAFRSEEVGPTAPLRSARPSIHVVLAPLEADSLRAVVESMAGPLPEEVVRLVTQLSQGSPFMAAAVMHGLIETRALVGTAAGWQLEAGADGPAQSSRHAAALLVRRLDSLPTATLRLLSIGAVLGKAFDVPSAAAIASENSHEAILALDHARRRQIVWADVRGTRCTFVHDKIREALLRRLSDEERRALHARAAAWLEETGLGTVFALAYHYDAAEDSARAVPFALAAAEQARRQHALGLSEKQYRIAERGAKGGADRGTQRRAAEGLGDILMLRGHYEEAALFLQRSVELAEKDDDRAEITGKLGELAFKRGDMQTASTSLEHALSLLGRDVPTTGAAFFARLTVEIFVQFLHSLFPRAFVGRRRDSAPATELLALRLYSRLAYAYWFQRGKIPCGWAHLRGLNLAERYRATAELAQAYSEHAPVMTMVPWFDRGIEYAGKSLVIRQSRGDIWGQGQSLGFFGVVLYGASRFEECIEKSREAVRLLERAGDRWEENTARWHIAFAHYRLGNLRIAIDACKEVHRLGIEIGDYQAIGISLGGWAKASGGRVPPELIAAELERATGDVHTNAEVLQAEGLRLLREGRTNDAVSMLEDAELRVRRAGLQQEYVAPVLPWLGTALRMKLERTPLFSRDERRATFARAKLVTGRAVRLARKYRNNLPHALREAGILAAIEGLTDRARALFDESRAVAGMQGARHELAQTDLARARLGVVLGWPDAARDLGDAELRTRAFEEEREDRDTAAVEETPASRVVTLSLADRFATVLDAGRRLVSALSQKAVFAELVAVTLALLRGERCIVLEVGEDGAFRPAASASGDDVELFGALARSAVVARRAVVVGDPTCASADELVVVPGVSSALCAPVLARGHVVACFCVVHRSITGLFGKDEVHLADFVATLTGAALENTEGFTKLTIANRELEDGLRKLTATQSQLALARHMASVGTLAAGVAHEINNPLAYVLANLTFSLEELSRLPGSQGDAGSPGVREVREALVEATAGAERVRAIVRDLKSSSRIDDDRRALIDVAQVMSSAINMATSEIRHRAKLVKRYEHVSRVHANEGRLAQVFLNLLVNAAQAIPDGRADENRIDVLTREIDGHVIIEVSDTGAGIPPEVLRRIFDPFFTTKPVGVGTGLGLSICHGILTALGGTIVAESTIGRGTTFRVSLPSHPEPTVVAPASAAELSSITAVRARILVIDDEAAIGRAFKRLLGKEHDVTVVTSAAEALELVAQNDHFQVIFCDLMMPHMTGSQLYARVKATASGAEKRFVFVTGGAFTETSREFLASVPSSHIEKPFGPDVVRAIVARMLGGKQLDS